jgi:hypothetical protein
MAAKKRTMSAGHKEALAVGRNESRAVSSYLKALEANKPKRGRKRTAETVKARLAKIDAEMRDADALSMLNLRQERLDLQNELATMNQKSDLRSLEADFVKAAKGYSQRKGITYGVWRQSGVAADVLKKAGINR